MIFKDLKEDFLLSSELFDRLKVLSQSIRCN